MELVAVVHASEIVGLDGNTHTSGHVVLIIRASARAFPYLLAHWQPGVCEPVLCNGAIMNMNDKRKKLGAIFLHDNSARNVWPSLSDLVLPWMLK